MLRSHVRGVLTVIGIVVGLGALALLRAEQGESLNCPVTHAGLLDALKQADGLDSSGLNNHYWAVVVNREGTVRGRLLG